MDQQLTIHYPSGNVLKIYGRFGIHGPITHERDSPYGVVIVAMESITIQGQVISAGSSVVLDPRCVVIGQDGDVIYSPREHHKNFPREMRQWMQRNPQWPAAAGGGGGPH